MQPNDSSLQECAANVAALIKTPDSFNWHKAGVWIAHDLDDKPVLATAATTPRGARAALGTQLNRPASELAGYSIVGYVPATIQTKVKVTL